MVRWFPRSLHVPRVKTECWGTKWQWDYLYNRGRWYH